jgi:Mycothiol maleylpyruvate isomerase N-terminal domain
MPRLPPELGLAPGHAESMNPTRQVFIDTANVSVSFVTSPVVVSRWNEPSHLTGMTVGGLACHLIRGGFTVLPAILDEAEPPGTRAFNASRFYAGLTRDLDVEVHRGIRQSSAQAADGGPGSLAGIDQILTELGARLAIESAGRRVVVMDGIEMALDDFLITRLVELVVHIDDLAASVGVPTPELPDLATDLVISCLTGVARRRHGDLQVVRALARQERRQPDVFPVF